MNRFDRNIIWLQARRHIYTYRVEVPFHFSPEPGWWRTVIRNSHEFCCTPVSPHSVVWGFKDPISCETFSMVIAWYGGTYAPDFTMD